MAPYVDVSKPISNYFNQDAAKNIDIFLTQIWQIETEKLFQRKGLNPISEIWTPKHLISLKSFN